LKQKSLYSNNVKTNLLCHICDNFKTQSLNLRKAVFTKPFFPIVKLAHLFLQKGRQKSNKLFSFPQQHGVLSAQYCASHSVQSKSTLPAAAWHFAFYKIN
jgi:hypothetical protein